MDRLAIVAVMAGMLACGGGSSATSSGGSGVEPCSVNGARRCDPDSPATRQICSDPASTGLLLWHAESTCSGAGLYTTPVQCAEIDASTTVCTFAPSAGFGACSGGLGAIPQPGGCEMVNDVPARMGCLGNVRGVVTFCRGGCQIQTVITAAACVDPSLG